MESRQHRNCIVPPCPETWDDIVIPKQSSVEGLDSLEGEAATRSHDDFLRFIDLYNDKSGRDTRRL